MAANSLEHLSPMLSRVFLTILCRLGQPPKLKVASSSVVARSKCLTTTQEPLNRYRLAARLCRVTLLCASGEELF
jgi:hypothetical protein